MINFYKQNNIGRLKKKSIYYNINNIELNNYCIQIKVLWNFEYLVLIWKS